MLLPIVESKNIVSPPLLVILGCSNLVAGGLTPTLFTQTNVLVIW
jgi:hypothetical protein